jgi:hypothetical protein
MKGQSGGLDFETVIDAGGRIEVPEGILSRPGTQAGSRVRVRLVPAGIADALERRNVTDEEVDRIAAVQLEERGQVIAFLLAEGALSPGAAAARRKGRGGN